MPTNISYQITSHHDSKADSDGKIAGHWTLFAAIALLAIVFAFCIGGAVNDPSLLLPQPTFVGP